MPRLFTSKSGAAASKSRTKGKGKGRDTRGKAAVAAKEAAAAAAAGAGVEEDGEDGGGGSMRRKAVKALKTLRANMPAALAKGVAEKGLEEKDVKNFLDLVYDKMDCDNAFGDLLQQVAVNEGMDVNMWIRGYVDMAVVETLWADIGAAAVQADIDANSKSHVSLTPIQICSI